jgi:hypothetical protein
MTVAHIREDAQPDMVEVMFLESTRFYRLRRSAPNFGPFLERLRVARQKREPVEIAVASPGSDLIADVKGKEKGRLRFATPGPGAIVAATN